MGGLAFAGTVFKALAIFFALAGVIAVFLESITAGVVLAKLRAD